MMKDYLIVVSLETKLAAESSITRLSYWRGNCGEISGKVLALHRFCSPSAHNEFSGAAWI
jgi:hypothetical protein